MVDSAQFLYILQAEREHLVTVQINLLENVQKVFEDQLYESFASEAHSSVAQAWNEQRKLVVRETMDKFLLPLGSKWAREWLREEVEDTLAKKAGDSLQDVSIPIYSVRLGLKLVKRLNQAPYRAEGLELGLVPSVMAISWGKGDPQKDAIQVVVLDVEGRLRDHLRLDNLFDDEPKKEFLDLLYHRDPDVIVVAGLTVQTKKLMALLKTLVNDEPAEGDKSASHGASQANGAGGWGSSQGAGGWDSNGAGGSGWGADGNNGAGDASSSQDSVALKKKEGKGKKYPIMYVNDEVARIYQHSKRAEDEYGRLPLTARYCVGLARYVQSPLIEYAALGRDLTAITFDDAQNLVCRTLTSLTF